MTTQTPVVERTQPDRLIANPDSLIARLANDRFGSDHAADRYALGWNDSKGDTARTIQRWINEARLPVALEELRDAPAMDLRLKATLTACEPLSDDERLFWEAL